MFLRKVKNAVLTTLTVAASVTILMALSCVDSLETDGYRTWFLVVGLCAAWIALFCLANKERFSGLSKFDRWMEDKLLQAEKRDAQKDVSDAIKNYYIAGRKVRNARKTFEKLLSEMS